MATKDEIKVLIAGDFLIFRSGLKILIETAPKFKVVGEASDLKEAVALNGKCKPDVVLVNSTEIETDGISLFLSLCSEASVIVLSNTREAGIYHKYILLGSRGLVLKEQNSEVLFEAILRVHAGELWFDRKIMETTIKHLLEEKKSTQQNISLNNGAVLTEREKEVLALVCKGMKNKTVGDELFISETTVRHHLTSIFEKLNVKTRLQLVVYAFSTNIVEIPHKSKVAGCG